MDVCMLMSTDDVSFFLLEAYGKPLQLGQHPAQSLYAQPEGKVMSQSSSPPEDRSSLKSAHIDHFQAYLHSCKASWLLAVRCGRVVLWGSDLPVLGDFDEFLSAACALLVSALFQFISHTDRLPCGF